MAIYPIKMLKDEAGTPFIPLVAPEAVIDTHGDTLADMLENKVNEPETEGTAGQVLTTDGEGGRTWTTVQGGGGGTSDYTALSNKPQINGTTLTGNKTSSDLGLASSADVLTKTNTTSYTPTGDYNPATKKYVDDAIGGILALTLTTGLFSDYYTDNNVGQLNSTDVTYLANELVPLTDGGYYATVTESGSINSAYITIKHGSNNWTYIDMQVTNSDLASVNITLAFQGTSAQTNSIKSFQYYSSEGRTAVVVDHQLFELPSSTTLAGILAKFKRDTSDIVLEVFENFTDIFDMTHFRVNSFICKWRNSSSTSVVEKEIPLVVAQKSQETASEDIERTLCVEAIYCEGSDLVKEYANITLNYDLDTLISFETGRVVLNNGLRSLNDSSSSPSVSYTISPETKGKATVVTFGYYDTGTVVITDPWSNTITINNVPSGSYIIGETDLTTAPSTETTMCEIFGAWNNDYTDGLIHKRWTIRYNPNETNKLVQYSYTQKAASPTYDGTGVFGWYTTASSGEDLTANYDVTPSDIYNIQLGSHWEWPSRVQTGATNSGMPYYMTSYSARTSGWDLYYVKYVSMNGSYYEYAYDDTNVYKEVYPDGGGVACFGKDTKVWTKTGEKTIDKVGLGEEVLVYDWCKDRVVYAPVAETFSHEQEEVYHIVLENDNDLYVTGDHPILERDNGKIPASTIKKGHVLMNDKGIGYPVKSNRKVQYNDTVYEIHMEGSVLNYFVGDNKIMVFNEIITGEAE